MRASETGPQSTVWATPSDSRTAAPASSIPDAAAVVDAVIAVAEQAAMRADLEPVLVAVEPFELLEPTVEPEPALEAETLVPAVEPEAAEQAAPAAARAPQTEPATEDPASVVDEFEMAARLFAFTGETPVQKQDAAPAPKAAVDAEGAATPAERVPGRRRRQLATASFSVGVMGIVGLLAVGMTTPADALAVADSDNPAATVTAAGDVEANEDIQAYVTPSTIESAGIERDENYSTVSLGEIASELGISNYSNFFVNDPNAAIQWPFAVGVPITYGFGMRSGRMHEGADFVPGQGAEIQAIAAGTVRTATSSGGGYGVEVVIDHIIDGQLISSRYAHMLYGSIKVAEGQHVEAGTILGETGDTGHSFGAHTHFEILAGGDTAIDPIEWLRANAGRSSLG
ncbi:M23 family metallopeptidase [Microbacterium sp. P5_E9]